MFFQTRQGQEICSILKSMSYCSFFACFSFSVMNYCFDEEKEDLPNFRYRVQILESLARDFNRAVQAGIDLKSQNYIGNLHFKRVIPITMKSTLPSGPLKTKLIIRNYNDYDKKPMYKS